MPIPRKLLVLVVTLTFGFAAVPAALAIEWTVEGKDLIDLESEKASISSSGENFEILVAELGLTVKCKTASGTGVITKEGASSSTVTLNSCTVVENKLCTVQSPGQSSGTIVATFTSTILEKEVGKVPKTYDAIEPTMALELLGALCPLAGEFEMEGKTAAEVPQVGEELVKRPQKFSKAIAEEAGVTSLALGESQAFLKGELTEKLTGAHEGQPVGTVPFSVRPIQLPFAGAGPMNALTVTIKNLSVFRKVKVVAITLFAGNYTINEPPGTCKITLEPVGMAGNSCVITVECNATPNNNGNFEVEADLLDANGNIIANGGKTVTMTC